MNQLTQDHIQALREAKNLLENPGIVAKRSARHCNIYNAWPDCAALQPAKPSGGNADGGFWRRFWTSGAGHWTAN
ncbi:MAG TPA: hypothetical protein VIC26_10285 [Marinagarivorans sp.]